VLFDTLETIWSRWTPDGFARYLADLRQQVTAASVKLVDPLTPD
jgi:hypothetical protein